MRLAKKYFGAVEIDGGPWCKIPEGKPGAGIVIKDSIADITLQQVLTRPEDFDVIATLNLNGDYLSDALAAQVGGIGIAPGGNINYITGHAIFEATHGTAPKYANKDVVNPGSVVLSGEMMFRYLGWTEAADLILKGLNGAIGSKRVTYDFARQMEGATEIKCSQFGDNIIATHVTQDRYPACYIFYNQRTGGKPVLLFYALDNCQPGVGVVPRRLRALHQTRRGEERRRAGIVFQHADGRGGVGRAADRARDSTRHIAGVVGD